MKKYSFKLTNQGSFGSILPVAKDRGLLIFQKRTQQSTRLQSFTDIRCIFSSRNVAVFLFTGTINFYSSQLLKDSKIQKHKRQNDLPKRRQGPNDRPLILCFTRTNIAFDKYFKLRWPLEIVQNCVSFIINQMNTPQKINQHRQQIAQNRRKYSVIDYQTRENLIRSVIHDGWSAADACRKYKVKMTTGCLIVRNYRNAQRIFQKPGRGGPTDNSNLEPQPQKINRSRPQRKRYGERIQKTEPSPVRTAQTILSEAQIKVESTQVRYTEYLPNLPTTHSPLFLPSFLQMGYQLCYIPNWNIIWQ